MLTAPFFSIVMPAYNAEKTIERAIYSVEEQDFRDFEFIIVDDGSTDRTSEIISRLSQTYSNIQHIKIPNAGPACARNAGIQKAAGQYLLFLDSDDEYLPGSLQKVHDLVNQNHADVLIYGFRIYNRDTNTYFHEYHPADSWCKNAENVNFTELYANNLLNQIWNKAYRMEFLREIGIEFPDYRYGEDRIFVIQSCLRARSISACSEELYNYILGNEDSLVHSYHANKFEICCEIHNQVQQLARRGTDADPGMLDYMFIKSVFSCMTDLCGKKSPLSAKEKRKQIKKIVCTAAVGEAASDCRCLNAAVKAICCVMRSGCVWMNYLFVKLATTAMRLLPNLTISLKHQH